jgi:hypothetical protein
MQLMCLLRPTWSHSRLQPEFRFIRTLQSPYHVVRDERTGRYRISSKAFSPSKADSKLSGDLEEILVSDGLSPIAMYPAVRNPVGAASLTIGQIRAAGAQVEHDPATWNWYHGSVSGTKARKVKQALVEAALEIIPIDQARAAELDQDMSSQAPSSSA